VFCGSQEPGLRFTRTRRFSASHVSWR
jgi:hypothetical protein